MGASRVKGKSKNSWVVLMVVGIVYSLTTLQRSDIQTVIPVLILVYKWNTAQIGWLNSAFIWAYALMQIPFGYISESRFGARVTLTIGILLVSLAGLIFVIFIANVAISILARAIMGVGSAAIWVPANPMLARWFPAKIRGMQTSILAFVGQLGFIIGSLAMPFMIAGSYSFIHLSAIQTAFLIVIIPCFIVTPFVYFFVQDRPGVVASHKKEANILTLTRNRRIANKFAVELGLSSKPIILTLIYCGFLGSQGINVWFPFFLVDKYHFTVINAGVVFSTITFVPLTLGILISGSLGDKIGHKNVIRIFSLISIFILLTVTLELFFFKDISITSFYIFLAIFSFSNSAFLNLWPLTTIQPPKVNTGIIGGMMNTGGNVTAALVAVIPGYFLAANTSYVPIFVLGLIFAFMAFLLSWFLPDIRMHISAHLHT